MKELISHERVGDAGSVSVDHDFVPRWHVQRERLRPALMRSAVHRRCEAARDAQSAWARAGRASPPAASRRRRRRLDPHPCSAFSASRALPVQLEPSHVSRHPLRGLRHRSRHVGRAADASASRRSTSSARARRQRGQARRHRQFGTLEQPAHRRHRPRTGSDASEALVRIRTSTSTLGLGFGGLGKFASPRLRHRLHEAEQHASSDRARTSACSSGRRAIDSRRSRDKSSR